MDTSRDAIKKQNKNTCTVSKINNNKKNNFQILERLRFLCRIFFGDFDFSQVNLELVPCAQSKFYLYHESSIWNN